MTGGFEKQFIINLVSTENIYLIYRKWLLVSQKNNSKTFVLKFFAFSVIQPCLLL